VKLIPYFALGQFDATNLTLSAVLMPLAPLATLAGAWVVRRMRPDVFYAFSYVTVGLIALKLVYDGIFDLVTGGGEVDFVTKLLSRLQLASQRFVCLGPYLIADSCRKTAEQFSGIC
jgi:hypothetical protein